MKKTAFIAIALLLITSMKLHAQQARYIHTNTYEGVVFARYCWQNLEMARHPYIPTNQEIERMERKIGISIRLLLIGEKQQQNFQGRCDLDKELQKFKRQYYGYWKGKEKIILAYFYKYPPKDWKTVISPISENGQCDEFQLEYDINYDKLFNFIVDLSME